MATRMGEEGDNHNTPLLADTPSSSVQLHGNFKRTGTLWTAIAHIITAVIGSGVLSLAWSVAQLGWIAGPLTLVGFAGIIVVSSSLLSDCYRSPDPEHGHTRNQTYMDAVRLNLGKKSIWVCAIVQQVSLFGVGIAYTITTSADARSPNPVTGKGNSKYKDAVKLYLELSTNHPNCGFSAIHKSTCIDKEGHQASCSYGNSFYMLLFGAIQIVCSQIPDFHNMEWLSFAAAIMSFSYSSIGFALGFAKVIGNGSIKGSIGGVTKGTAAKKMWTVFQAIGDIAFAYPYSIVLLEIQNTLKSPPAENRTMKKASMISIFITTLFYLCCGCFGYAAFGDDTPGNLLTGFGFFEPYWLIDFANACVIVHLVGGYQVYSQPVFAAVEKWLSEKYPNSGFVNNFYMLKAPLLPAYKVTLLRLCFRTAYVVTTTAIATIFPYFNEVLGVLGAFNFWPLTIYFPVKMYFVQRKIAMWSRKWVILQTFSIVCLLVAVMALVGSIEGLVSAKLS